MSASSRRASLSDSEGVYESFADMVLCTVIVLVTLVVVLALNIVKEMKVTVDANNFSGGISRPWLYIQAQAADYSKTTSPELEVERAIFGNEPSVLVNLFSPSTAFSSTAVEDGKTVAGEDNQSFYGQLDLSAYHFLQLAAGINPGSFMVDGSDTALMLPKFVHKNVMIEPNQNNGYSTIPENQIALDTMAMAWPIYRNEIDPRRSQTEYKHAKTTIYIETLATTDGSKKVMIGHSVFNLPEDINNGRLSWLIGFASGLTEIVYLGEAWSKPEEQLNKRIDFFLNNGYEQAASTYRRFSYPSQLTANQQNLARQIQSVYSKIPAGQVDAYIRSAEAQKALSKAILTKNLSNKAYLPPLLAHRDAWQAYIDNCIIEQAAEVPPEWLLTDFLQPLGFDQAIVSALRTDA